MNPVETKDTFLFPWRLPPLKWSVLSFLLTPVIVLALRVFWEGDFYLTRWWSFKIGDTFCLPVFAYFASKLVEGRTSKQEHTIASSVPFQLILAGIGIAIFVGVQFLHVLTEDGYSKVFFLPSELWHTAISAVLPYEFLWGFFAVIGEAKRSKRLRSVVFILAMIAALAYTGTVVYDNGPFGQDNSHVTVHHR